MSDGARSRGSSASPTGTDAVDRGSRQEVVEVGVAPLAAALLDQPPAGDVAQHADAAEGTGLVAEPGRERRGRRVGLVLLAPDQQPRAGGDERGVVLRPGEHR